MTRTKIKMPLSAWLWVAVFVATFKCYEPNPSQAFGLGIVFMGLMINPFWVVTFYIGSKRNSFNA